MRIIVVLFVLMIGSASAVVVGAQDTTPTPEPTATASAPTAGASETAGATPAPSPTPTIADMAIFGQAWVNGRWAPSSAIVRALVGETECGSGKNLYLPDGGPLMMLTIASAATKAGCGTDGALVTFTINGVPANETQVFYPGLYFQKSLTVGPPFQQVYGDFRAATTDILGEPGVDARVVPLINGRACGYPINPLRGEGPTWAYGVVVDSTEITPGCGQPGATITLVLRGTTPEGTVIWQRIAPRTIPWEPGGSTELDLDFTSSPRVSGLPSAGSGGRHDAGRSAEAAVIAAAGAIVLIAGAAVARRRRAISDQHPADHP